MRRRLALLVGAAMALVLVAFLVPLALLLRAAAEDRAVAAAAAQAQALGALVATADARSLRLSVEQANVDGAHPVSVYLPDGTVLGAAVAATPAVRLAAQRGSFTVAHAAGREVVVAVQGLPGGTAVVRSFVPERDLRRGVARSWLVLAVVGAGLLLLGLAVADRLAVAVVRPIGALATVSEELAGGDLDRRAPAAGPPEVRAVAVALNRLAGRIRDLLRQEREAAADLSHRMRTPMTALRLDAEGLADPADAARMLEHVAALDAALTEVIADARRAASAEPPACDAAAVVAERVAFWAVLAEDQGRAVRAELDPGPLPVAICAADLAAAVDALLGNVFAHTDEGVGFAVTLRAAAGGATLSVEDEGPGFDPAAGARGVSGGGSSGLGLDIARRTAESTGGGLSVAGSRVTLALLTDP
ncbi:sensor histidine kinase [Dactylosporangium sp. CA-092794]|uniref:sensor histidine kinase n=1 Tax=Dactylosporangium sp. CA-092794 TaxID=3239929 RepID=UPI003D93351B